jgi:hypothetical protein
MDSQLPQRQSGIYGQSHIGIRQQFKISPFQGFELPEKNNFPAALLRRKMNEKLGKAVLNIFSFNSSGFQITSIIFPANNW